MINMMNMINMHLFHLFHLFHQTTHRLNPSKSFPRFPGLPFQLPTLTFPLFLLLPLLRSRNNKSWTRCFNTTFKLKRWSLDLKLNLQSRKSTMRVACDQAAAVDVSCRATGPAKLAAGSPAVKDELVQRPGLCQISIGQRLGIHKRI